MSPEVERYLRSRIKELQERLDRREELQYSNKDDARISELCILASHFGIKI